MSVRLNTAIVGIDLTTAFDVDPVTLYITLVMWAKKVGAFVDYDPFVSITSTLADRNSSVEMYNSGSGGTRTFEAGVNQSGLSLGSPTLTVDDWHYVAFTRPAGASISTAIFWCGDETGLTSHTNKAMAHTALFRYLNIGQLAQTGLVTNFNGEVAHCRLFATAGPFDTAMIQAERDSATPVVTSGLVFSHAFNNTSSVDQGPNGITFTTTGSVTNGASDPPPGAAGTSTGMLRKFMQYY